MRFTRPSAPTLVLLSAFVIINLLAFRWTAKFLRHKIGASRLQYGAQMPKLEGRGYSNDQVFAARKNLPTLVLYFTPQSVTGRSVSLLKYCQAIQRETAQQFQILVITAGVLPEIQQLLQEKQIDYSVINDNEEELAGRLGLNHGESGTFFFDKNGTCILGSRQAASVDDLQQLLASQNINGFSNSSDLNVAKGKLLPSWQLVDVRSGERVMSSTIPSHEEQLWIFFLADCFACGAPDPNRYLAKFERWQKLSKEATAPIILVFDSAFLRNEVLRELDQFQISSTAFIASQELSVLSKFVAARDRSTNQPLIVRTDKNKAIVKLSSIADPDTHPVGISVAESLQSGPRYERILQRDDLDLYDVDSHRGSYYVTDRTRNSVLVLSDRFETQKSFGGIGSGPGRLFHPGHIAVTDDGIVYVQDGGNDRIESFRIDGTYLNTFSPEAYVGFAAGKEGVYLGQPEKGALVTAYSPDGRTLRSFGKLKKYSEIYGQSKENLDKQFGIAINRVRLSVDRDGNILVSFMLIPILQKYTPDGKLVFDTNLEGPEIEKLRASTGHLSMSMDGIPAEIIALEAIARPNGEIAVMLTDRSIFVTNQNGQKLRVVRPQSEHEFTPEMTGITPGGEPLVIGLSPRSCYRVLG